MAEVRTGSYPMLPAKQWWALRNNFKQSLPKGAVTSFYLHSRLGITEATAKENILPVLKKIGLIDQDGKVVPLGERWRLDEEYPKVCEEIRTALYPTDLLDAVTDPATQTAEAEAWFMSRARVGQSGARQMASFLRILLEADPSKTPDASKGPSAPRPAGRKVVSPKKSSTSSNGQGTGISDEPVVEPAPTPTPTPHVATAEPRVAQPQAGIGPTLHIDVQIHIASDASLEQIDKIFASMAKYLYGRDSA